MRSASGVARNALTCAANKSNVTPNMSIRDDLISEIESFLRETGMSRTAFGVKALNDRALMVRLSKGSGLHSDTIDKIRAFMARERAARKTKRPSRGPLRAVVCTA